MDLTQLPAELVHGICAQCGPSTIRNLRIVNKLSLAITNEHLLTDLKLFWLLEDYRFAVKLLQDPHVAKGVRSLAISTGTFPEPRHVDFKTYVPYHDPKWALYSPQTLIMTSTISWNTHRHTQKRNALYAEERPKAERLHHIKPALAKLDRGTIHQTDTQLRSDRRRRHKVNNAFFAKGERKRPSAKQLHEAYEHFLSLASQTSDFPTALSILSLVDQIFISCPHINTVMLQAPEPTHPSPDVGRQYRQAMVAPWSQLSFAPGALLFIGALSHYMKSRPPLRSLELDGVTCPWIVPGTLEDLTSLRSVRLTIHSEHNFCTCDERRGCGHECKGGLLANFFNMAPNLQHLVLAKCDGMPICLRGMVGHYVWPRLTNISLSNFSCTAKELVDFLGRHSSTLEELNLDSPVIKHSRWEHLFSLLAEALPQLERVHLRGLFRGPASDNCIRFSWSPADTETSLARKVEDYILHGGDDVPELFDESGESEEED